MWALLALAGCAPSAMEELAFTANFERSSAGFLEPDGGLPPLPSGMGGGAGGGSAYSTRFAVIDLHGPQASSCTPLSGLRGGCSVTLSEQVGIAVLLE